MEVQYSCNRRVRKERKGFGKGFHTNTIPITLRALSVLCGSILLNAERAENAKNQQQLSPQSHYRLSHYLRQHIKLSAVFRCEVPSTTSSTDILKPKIAVGLGSTFFI